MSNPFEVATVRDLSEYVVTRLDENEYPFFTLILGAGFTYPLVPTARRMVADIPWWLHWRKHRGRSTGSAYAPEFRDRPFQDQTLETFERSLWERMMQTPEASKLGAGFKDGLPDLNRQGGVTDAYKLLMTRALQDLKTRRQYLRDAIGRIGRKINPPHLHLAGILGAQDSPSWQWRSPFCRTILTTNFDPLLQRCLQMVHKLYFMSDRPEMIDAPEDDDTEAIHLMYTHGSVHRYRLLNTDQEIADARERNAEQLRRYLERHSVIIVGYNGWDDATMDALASASSFDGRVFWCDVLDPAQARAGLSPRAVEFLESRRDTVVYVQATAADVLEQLHRSVVGSPAPEFVIRPVSPLLRQLRNVEMTEAAAAPGASRQEVNSFGELVKLAIKRLEEADRIFTTNEAPAPQTTRQAPGPDPITADVPADAPPGELASRAVLAAWSGDAATATVLLTRIIEHPGATAEEKADALVKRGKSYEEAKDHVAAVNDYAAAANLAGPGSALNAKALDGLTESLSNCGQIEAALQVYEKLLAHPALEPAERAHALFRRGILYGDLGKRDEEFADYTAAVEVPESNEVMRAGVLINRGTIYRERGELDKSIADYNVVLGTPGLPGWMRARALRNRGNALMDLERTDEALDNYLPAIEIEDASVDDRSKAGIRAAGIFIGRNNIRAAGAIFRKLMRVASIQSHPATLGQLQLGLLTVSQQLGDADETRKLVTAILANPGASRYTRSLALRTRASAKAEAGDSAGALEDYNDSVDVPELSDDELADALMARAVFHHAMGRPEPEEADYTRVIGLAGVSPSTKADAYHNRSWSRYAAGDYAGLVRDARAALEIDPSRGLARSNLAIGLLLTVGEAQALVELKTAAQAISAVAELEMVVKDLDDLEKSGKAQVSAKNLKSVLEARRAELAAAGPPQGG